MSENRTTPNDRWQWIAIVAIILMLVCGAFGLIAYVRSVNITTAPERESELQAQINVQNTQIALLVNGTVTPTPAGATNTEIAPTIAITEVVSSTPTATEALAEEISKDEFSLLIGGRLDQDGVYCMYSAEISTSLLEDGTALQQYHEQLTEAGFDNSCNLDAKLEDLNDGVKIAVTDGRAYFMPEDGDVPHSTISWIQYDPNKGILICHDDSGTAGSWDGACKGKKVWVTEWISYDDLLTSSKFQPWAEPFAQIEHLFDGKIFNGKIEILEVHN